MSITLCRSNERQHERSIKRESWRTFRRGHGYGSLEVLDEMWLAPRSGGASHSHHAVEIITYVREGTLANEDSLGRSGLVHTGEFQRITAGRGIQHSEANPSQTHRVQVFQISIRSAEGAHDASQEQRRFSAAQRRGVLCAVASPDGRRGSLRIHQNAVMYSAILEHGQHVIHELSPGRSAWFHVVEGEVMLGDVVLSTGDGGGVTAECAVSLTAREGTEILLFDVESASSTTEYADHAEVSLG